MAILRKSLPPLTATVTFEAAARHLSFTLAAKEMHVTQAAVSRQIRLLEEHFGQKLFHRDNNNLQLTRAGELFFSDIKHPLAEIANAAQKIQYQANKDELIIACTIGFSDLWLTPKLADFRRIYPQVNVRVVATDSDIDHLNYIVDGMFSVSYGNNANLEQSFYICDELVYPVCSPDFLAGQPELQRPQDLLAQTLITVSNEHWDNIETAPINWDVWFKSCGIHELPQSYGLSFSNTANAVNAALLGHGIALSWHHLVADLVEQERLVQLTNHVLDQQRGFYFYCNKHQHSQDSMAKFSQWVLDSFK